MNTYLVQVIWLLMWPIIIFVSYKIVLFMINKFEKSKFSKVE